MPIFNVAVLSEDGKRGAQELTTWATQVLQKKLENVRGVGSVSVVGGLARQINIYLKPAAMEALGIGADQVVAAVRSENQELPLGSIRSREQERVVQINARIKRPEEFRDIVVARKSFGGGAGTAVRRRRLRIPAAPVRLWQVADIVDGPQEVESLALYNGQRTVLLSVQKSQGENTIEVVDGLFKALEAARPLMPPGVKVEVNRDNSRSIRVSVANVKRTLFEGAALTILIVFLFLNSWRSTVITGLTLPIALIGTFLFMYMFGFTINTITMMALSLCVGLLIDDAIVVRENIVRHVQMGKSAHEAALSGTNEIGLAVLATTLSIVAVFLPIGFMGGIVGKFFHEFGLTIVAAVLISMFVSFTLDPMLSSVWHDPQAERGHGAFGADGRRTLYDRTIGRVTGLFDRLTLRLSAWLPGDPALVAASTGWPPCGIALATFVGSFFIIPILGAEFVPKADFSETQVNFYTPVGSSLEVTEMRARQVDAVLREMPEVRYTVTTINSGQAAGKIYAATYVRLVDRKDRKRSVDRDGGAAARAAGAHSRHHRHQHRPDRSRRRQEPAVLDPGHRPRRAGAAVEGDHREAAADPRPGRPRHDAQARQADGRDRGPARRRLRRRPQRQHARRPPCAPWSPARRSATGARPTARTTTSTCGSRRRAATRSATCSACRSTSPPRADGSPRVVRLSQVADVRAVDRPEPDQPARPQPRDQRRRQRLRPQLRRRLGRHQEGARRASAGRPATAMSFGGSTKNMTESFDYALGALGLAVVFIYMILASQFRSFLQPLALMSSLPLTLIGVVLALLMFRSTLNMFSIIGIVMLMGLVTKNAILLIDFAIRAQRGEARRRGRRPRDARRVDGPRAGPALAAEVRLRPILMTTLAMVFGMVPLAFALSEGSEQRAPMGQAVIGGVITSSLLTLVVVPVVYCYLDDLSRWVKRRVCSAAPSPVLSTTLPCHRARHEHRTSPLQHDRAADPPLGGARPRRAVAARRWSSARTSCRRRTARWPSSTPRCRCRTASRCSRPRSRRACCRSSPCSATSACSRSAPARATWRRCWRTRRST